MNITKDPEYSELFKILKSVKLLRQKKQRAYSYDTLETIDTYICKAKETVFSMLDSGLKSGILTENEYNILGYKYVDCLEYKEISNKVYYSIRTCNAIHKKGIIKLNSDKNLIKNSMKIGLHDADAEFSKAKKKFPNLALMKISAYHKMRGDTVEWWIPLKEEYDMVYSSKIFTFTPKHPQLPKDAILGGTGYDITSKLPPDIESAPEDYSIYPKCDFNIAFLTRGCNNNCSHCCVPEKEGRIHPDYICKNSLENLNNRLNVVTGEIVSKVNEVRLMDNNFLQYSDCLFYLEKLAKMSYKIDFNQGLDARLVTTEIADALVKIKWRKYLRFSCDTVENLKYIERTVLLLSKRGIKPYIISVYMLVRDIKEAEYVAESLRSLGVSPYTQPYRDFKNNLEPSWMATQFARWVNHKAIFNSCSFNDYKK